MNRRGCDVSKFPWSYGENETCLLITGGGSSNPLCTRAINSKPQPSSRLGYTVLDDWCLEGAAPTKHPIANKPIVKQTARSPIIENQNLGLDHDSRALDLLSLRAECAVTLTGGEPPRLKPHSLNRVVCAVQSAPSLPREASPSLSRPATWSPSPLG